VVDAEISVRRVISSHLIIITALPLRLLLIKENQIGVCVSISNACSRDLVKQRLVH